MNARKCLLIAQAVLCILCAGMLGAGIVRLYFEGAAFQADEHPDAWIFTREKVGAVLLPCLVPFLLSFGVTAASVLLGIRSDAKPAKTVSPPAAVSTHTKRQTAARWAILAIALVCIALGIWNGSMRDVLYKAINLCTECIGLG